MKHSELDPATNSMTHRLVTGAFGAFFTTTAIVVFVVSERTICTLLAVTGLGFLGINAVVSAYRNTRSIIARIGPLP